MALDEKSTDHQSYYNSPLGGHRFFFDISGQSYGPTDQQSDIAAPRDMPLV